MSETMHNIFGRAGNHGATATEEAAPDADAELTEAEFADDPEAVGTADDDVENTETGDDSSEVEARSPAGVRGNTTVGDGVVSKVVNMVARKADGVHRLDDEDSSVTVEADVATIRIALVVEYGHAVRALAEQVRIDVVDAVEQVLGLDVAAVDVHVGDIHHPEADPASV